MSVPANFNGQTPKIDPANAVVLPIDYQSGLSQTAKDMSMAELRVNATTLTKVATLMKIPVITTASVPQGPNGPLIPETHEAVPYAQYIACKGEVNAWDNPELVAAVEATGKKQLIIAGIITSVCMVFPSIAAVHDGYQVFAVIDASDTYPRMAQEVILAWAVQVGVVLTDTAATRLEIQRIQNRDDVVQFAEAYSVIFPYYQPLIESYAKAQAVVSNHEQLDSQRK